MKIDAGTLDEEASHRLLKSCVVPRPIAWVSTLNLQGIPNLAPFSTFTFLATHPPMVGFSIALRNGLKKDTLINIESTKEFVVNLVTEKLIFAVNDTSADYPPDVSEILMAGLTTLASERVKPPRIAESPVHLECIIQDILRLGDSEHSFIIGEVVLFHIQDSLYRDGEINQYELKPVARLAGDQFGLVDKILEIPRKQDGSHKEFVR